MIAKILIGSGLIITVGYFLSIIIGILHSFLELTKNESTGSGIGAVGGVIFSSIFGIIFLFLGIILILIGGIISYRNNAKTKS